MARTDPLTAWLQKLGALTAGSLMQDEARAKVELYAGMLRAEFDSSAFCQRSLAEVAARCRFFPAYGELCGMLRDWERANRPIHVALPAPVIPDLVEPTEAEKLAVSLTIERWREDMNDAGGVQADGCMAVSRFRLEDSLEAKILRARDRVSRAQTPERHQWATECLQVLLARQPGHEGVVREAAGRMRA
jgi:hypothetical protein